MVGTWPRQPDKDTTLDPELVLVCIEVMKPQTAVLNSGAFGQSVDLTDVADPQTALLAMVGRHA